MSNTVIPDRLLRPQDVARLLYVHPRTVSQWARDGRIPSILTPGGHRRFAPEVIQAILEGK